MIVAIIYLSNFTILTLGLNTNSLSPTKETKLVNEVIVYEDT